MPVIGARQSPIKIVAKDALQIVNSDRLFTIKYRSRNYHGVFVGDCPHGNFKLDGPYPQVQFRGKVFELQRIHIHYKSEHLIDSDVQRDFEVHLLHVQPKMTLDDPKLVIAILYHESARAGREGTGKV